MRAPPPTGRCARLVEGKDKKHSIPIRQHHRVGELSRPLHKSSLGVRNSFQAPSRAGVKTSNPRGFLQKMVLFGKFQEGGAARNIA